MPAGDVVELSSLRNDRPAAQLGITAAALVSVGVVELAASMGHALLDPRPLFLLAIVFAATLGGAVPALVTVVATWAYLLHYFGAGGHASHAPLPGAFGFWTYALIAPATAFLVLAKRGRSRRLAIDAIDKERTRR